MTALEDKDGVDGLLLGGIVRKQIQFSSSPIPRTGTPTAPFRRLLEEPQLAAPVRRIVGRQVVERLQKEIWLVAGHR
jgi:hypothetical protein